MGGTSPPTSAQAHFCKTCKSVNFCSGVGEGEDVNPFWPLTFPVFKTRQKFLTFSGFFNFRFHFIP